MQFTATHLSDGYSSDLEDILASRAGTSLGTVSGTKRYDKDEGGSNREKGALLFKPPPPSQASTEPSSKPALAPLHSQHFHNTISMDAYSRHKKFINDYVLFYGRNKDFMRGSSSSAARTESQILKEQYRFLRTEEDDQAENALEAWEKKLAKKYYDKLFKEYCIVDLTRYREGKVGMRWRVEKEVMEGKGQFTCGNKSCNAASELNSFEVPFKYKEAGEVKSALVKVRVCPNCARKLNYKKIKEQEREERKRQKREKKRRKEDEDEEERQTAAELKENGAQPSKRPKREVDKSQAERNVAVKKEKGGDVGANENEYEQEQEKNPWKAATNLAASTTQEDAMEAYFHELFP
ncbi:FRA10A associated CGG repeat 1 [Balamuthia mandrillaris]